jgi:hypothetical protein
MIKLKHYVEFLYPGIFVSESSVNEVKDRDPDKVVVPKECFAFLFFDRTETIVDDEILVGKRKNESGRYYINGVIYTLEQVKNQFPESKILISNIQCNKWNKVIKTRAGNWQPFEKNDTVIHLE